MTAPRWTPEEDAALAEHYREHGPSWDGWATLLPGRSVTALGRRACQLGLTDRRRKPQTWTEDEERVLLSGVAGLSRRLGRSPLALLRHAEHMVVRAMGERRRK